jgi:hypothetical protein
LRLVSTIEWSSALRSSPNQYKFWKRCEATLSKFILWLVWSAIAISVGGSSHRPHLYYI